MSDARVMFLIWFVGIAIVVAVILIVIEIRMKRGREKEMIRMKERTPMEKMKIALSESGDARRKLEVINKTAKNYFKERFLLSARLDYSELAKDFEKRKRPLEVEFCKGMFESYYSNKELTNERANDLANLLIRASEQEVVAEKVARAPGVFDKVDTFLGSIKNAVMGKINRRVTARNEKEDRAIRSRGRESHELSSWIKKAVRMGYDRDKVFDLLKEGKKSDKEIKKILKFFNEELEKVMKKDAGLPHEGVAHKIIGREKDGSEE